MPYIKQELRGSYNKAIDQIYHIPTKGELEYCIYRLMTIYMSDKPIKYTTLHDTVYSAMHCADEFRRRNLDVREDAAREENGDVL